MLNKKALDNVNMVMYNKNVADNSKRSRVSTLTLGHRKIAAWVINSGIIIIEINLKRGWLVLFTLFCE